MITQAAKQQAKILALADKAASAWRVAVDWQREYAAAPAAETLERATNALWEAIRASRSIDAELITKARKEGSF